MLPAGYGSAGSIYWVGRDEGADIRNHGLVARKRMTVCCLGSTSVSMFVMLKDAVVSMFVMLKDAVI
jgi:hypothetical protein